MRQTLASLTLMCSCFQCQKPSTSVRQRRLLSQQAPTTGMASNTSTSSRGAAPRADRRRLHRLGSATTSAARAASAAHCARR
eukprot:9482834-Pyramimonas_sp.AAC.1